jgi:NCAIR mutase (PurE)-related protein
MGPEQLRTLLDAVASGATSAEDALVSLEDLPFEDLGYATVDHHRSIRKGIPEVIYGEGKTVEQIAGIVRSIVAKSGRTLVTRIGAEAGEALLEDLRDLSPRYDPISRTLIVDDDGPRTRGKGTIVVVTGGTADMPVAEEAAVCAEAMGNEVVRIHDVGVAGIHRVLAHRKTLRSARVLIVVAGMEGALPSVVGGLVDRPVIAVPTSVGYGAALGGLAALLGMLTSCAAGVTVVNIDNGFGAAYAATLINRQ